MPEEQRIHDLEEILNILDSNIGHFADKLAKWIFKKTEFLRGLVFILKDDIVQHLDFERAKVVSVERIIMTGAEALIQQGRINEKRTVVLRLVRHRFADISDTVLNEITAIDDLVRLDDLFDQVLTAEKFEDIDFSENTNGT